MSKLKRENAILAVIDIQEKLTAVIHGREELEKNADRLIRGARVLGIPVLVTEQYPKGIGGTVSSLRAALEETSGFEPIQKMCFSSAGCDAFAQQLTAAGRRQVLLCGIEAHVCVYQTAMDLLRDGFEVHLVADAVSSRRSENKEIALRRLEREGVLLTSTEMALFELTVEAGTDEFRAISRLVK